MKPQRHIFVAIAAAALGAAALSCEKSPVIPLRDIVFSGAPERINVGDSVLFVVDCLPAYYNCGEPAQVQQWTSSKPAVASVSPSGVVRGLQAGRTEITLRWGDFLRTAKLEVDAQTFITDPTLLQFCLEHFDTNHDGVLQQIEVTSVQGMDLTELAPYHPQLSLQGIEAFSGLEFLSLSFLELTDVDLSRNTKLRRLVCDNTNLTHLDLSQNTNLEEIDCHSCDSLTTLLLPAEAGNALNVLACFGCQLATIDFSASDKLEYIDCRHNQLTHIDVSAAELLTQLSISGNPLLSITFAPEFDMQQLKQFDREAVE